MGDFPSCPYPERFQELVYAPIPWSLPWSLALQRCLQFTVPPRKVQNFANELSDSKIQQKVMW